MQRIAIVAAVVLVAVGLAGAQKLAKSHAGKADPRVETQLKALDLKYEVDKDGDYKLVYDLGENRTQVVFINSATNKVGDMEVREIWSPAMAGQEAPDAKVLQKVLEYSQDRVIGAWQAMGGENTCVLDYAVKLPVECSDKMLGVAAIVAANSADKMEKELSGGKDDL